MWAWWWLPYVTRLSTRLGLTAEADPVKIEQSLMKLVPRDEWTLFSHWADAARHVRRRCDALQSRIVNTANSDPGVTTPSGWCFARPARCR